jgi:hypothetical protein
MLWTFPFVWLVLSLPFASALVIARTRPLRSLSGRYHPLTWITGAVGLGAFLAAFIGLLPAAWTTVAVLSGGAVSGLVCFWPRRPDDGGEEWRRWSPAPDEGPPPPDPPGHSIDWHEFDRLRAHWGQGHRVAP